MIIEPYTWRSVAITAITRVSCDTVAIQIERPANYSFIAGQYCVMRITPASGQPIIRQYSFSSSPASAWLEFMIQKEPGGEASSWIYDQAKPGDKLEISQSFGHFTFQDESMRPILLIAGRVGIAPFMSYLRQHLATEVHLIYSVRSAAATCCWDEIEPLTTRVITSLDSRIDHTVLAPYVTNHPIVYICGSRQFADAMQGHLNGLSVPATNIRRELFTL